MKIFVRSCKKAFWATAIILMGLVGAFAEPCNLGPDGVPISGSPVGCDPDEGQLPLDSHLWVMIAIVLIYTVYVNRINIFRANP